MIKRGDWVSGTGYNDWGMSFVAPASERSAGMMLGAFRSLWEDGGIAPFGRQFADGDEAAFARASASIPSGSPLTVASVDFPAVIDLATLDGTNGFRLKGVDQGDRSGCSVSSAGDVNGDGIDDIVIGARYGDRGEALNAGESYIVFGSVSGFGATFDLSTLDGTNGIRLVGVQEYDSSGFSVSSAGDVNGDGFDDVIIGAAYAGDEAISGKSYVVFGRAQGFDADIDLNKLNGSNGFRLDGFGFRDFSGWSVSSAGDVNGDGFDDIIIGSRNASSRGDSMSGESYVVFGKADGFPPQVKLAQLDGTNGFRIEGANKYNYCGSSVSGAGDINGDGFDDIIVGAPGAGAGKSYVVFGMASGFVAKLNVATLDGATGFSIEGVNTDDRAGASVSSAGDVNGDGFDDIIIGAPSADADSANFTGESYVVFGHDGGFAANLDLATLDGTNGFRIDGIDALDGSGTVSNAGDVNGDGFDDIIVGASGGSPGGDGEAGESYVVFGKAGDFAASLDLATLDGSDGFRLEGIRRGDESGSSVSSAGDVNDDGFDDIIIGAGRAGKADVGESYVVFGQAPTEAVTRIGSAANQTIRGGDFDDTLLGEGGNDRLGGGAGADTLDGGIGNDWAYYDNADSGVRAALDAPEDNTGDAAGDAYISIENLLGTAFDDALTGDPLANRLRGEAGADTLSGRGGNDTLAGGAGQDRLIGGKGVDSFAFGSLVSFDADRIRDFTSGVDKIALDDDVFGFAEGALPTGSFVTGAVAQDADDRVIYNSANGQLFFDADGTGAQAQVLIATLTGAPILTAADIVVV